MIELLIWHPSYDVSELAKAAMAGEDSVFALHDALLEAGESMNIPIEAGKCYVIKTVAQYYLGRVVEVSWMWVVLEQVTEIYETGDINNCWANGTIENSEHYPLNVKIPIPMSSIVAAPEWPLPLPKREAAPAAPAGRRR